MENRLNALVAAAGKKDKSVDFADLGVDALFVDESHEFKNLAFQTTMNVSGLGNVMGSAKALDMFIKCRYLQREHDGRGVYFMTGTPVSNTIAEVYTLQRYMQYEELKAKGIEHFDAWASTFGQITNAWELDATGVNYKLKSRFAKFQNVPELLSMYRSFADTIRMECSTWLTFFSIHSPPHYNYETLVKSRLSVLFAELLEHFLKQDKNILESLSYNTVNSLSRMSPLSVNA